VIFMQTDIATADALLAFIHFIKDLMKLICTAWPNIFSKTKNNERKLT